MAIKALRTVMRRWHWVATDDNITNHNNRTQTNFISYGSFKMKCMCNNMLQMIEHVFGRTPFSAHPLNLFLLLHSDKMIWKANLICIQSFFPLHIQPFWKLWAHSQKSRRYVYFAAMLLLLLWEKKG